MLDASADHAPCCDRATCDHIEDALKLAAVGAVVIALVLGATGEARTFDARSDFPPGVYSYTEDGVGYVLTYISAGEWWERPQAPGGRHEQGLVGGTYYGVEEQGRLIDGISVAQFGGEGSPGPTYMNRIFMANLAEGDVPSGIAVVVGPDSAAKAPGAITVPSTLEIEETDSEYTTVYRLNLYSRAAGDSPSERLAALMRDGYAMAPDDLGPPPPEIEADPDEALDGEEAR